MTRLVSIIGIILVCVLSSLLIRNCERVSELESALESSTTTVKIWEDKYSRSNAEIQVLKADFKTVKRMEQKLLDSISGLGVKPKTITKIITITKHTRDTITLSPDSTYHDKWTSFSWLGNGKVSFAVRDSITLLTYEKKHGFLKRKSTYLTRAISHNPSTQFTGIQSVEIVPRERKFSLGMFAGPGITISPGGSMYGGISVGIGINYKIL